MTSANDLLFQGGLPSLSFKDAKIGHHYDFTITKVLEPRQQRDITDNSLKFWDDGRAMMTVPVEVKLDEVLPTDDNRGERSWWIPIGSQMHAATRDAIREAGASGLEPGAHVTVRLESMEAASNKKLNDKKIYKVSYKEPAPGNSAVMAGHAEVSSGPPATDPAALSDALAGLTASQREALGLPPA